MKSFIGTRIIKAEPQNAQAYRSKHQMDDSGCKVVYPDGYTSWSPKDVFEASYREFGSMTFGLAIESIKMGKKVARAGWNGKGMFVFLVNGSTFKVSRAPLLGIFPEGHEINYKPHIDIKNVDGSISTWVPSIGDVMAEDWLIV